MIHTLAADVGGTNIRAAVVSESGEVIQPVHSRIPLGERNMPATVLVSKLTSFLGEMITNDPDISAVGIGFPGFFLGQSGILAASPNLPELKQVNLAERLSESLKLPVSMQNDALCAAIGEHRFGAGKGLINLLHLTLGTGIGGGLILNHTPYTGEGGMAMEFGHLCVADDENARLCGCGGHGCVESYASATAISARYLEATTIQTSSEDIYRRAEQSDEVARAIIESAGHYLGMAIAEAVKLLDIRTVTISGGMTGAWSLLHPSIMASLNNHLIQPLQGKISVVRSTLDDQAGLLGAASLRTLGGKNYTAHTQLHHNR